MLLLFIILYDFHLRGIKLRRVQKRYRVLFAENVNIIRHTVNYTVYY